MALWSPLVFFHLFFSSVQRNVWISRCISSLKLTLKHGLPHLFDQVTYTLNHNSDRQKTDLFVCLFVCLFLVLAYKINCINLSEQQWPPAALYRDTLVLKRWLTSVFSLTPQSIYWHFGPQVKVRILGFGVCKLMLDVCLGPDLYGESSTTAV